MSRPAASANGFGTIGHNVARREDVDDVMAQARRASAKFVKSPQDTFYAGYTGYFRDPTAHVWEVACNPASIPVYEPRARRTATAWKRSKVVEETRDHRVSIAIALVGLYVGAGGTAKLLGVPYVHSSFPKLGLPVWFGYFIGACEVLGSIALLMPPLSALAAMGIGIIMVGATYYHATYTPIFQAAPAFILTILCAYVFLERRGHILKFGQGN